MGGLAPAARAAVEAAEVIVGGGPASPALGGRQRRARRLAAPVRRADRDALRPSRPARGGAGDGGSVVVLRRRADRAGDAGGGDLPPADQRLPARSLPDGVVPRRRRDADGARAAGGGDRPLCGARRAAPDPGDGGGDASAGRGGAGAAGLRGEPDDRALGDGGAGGGAGGRGGGGAGTRRCRTSTRSPSSAWPARGRGPCRGWGCRTTPSRMTGP